MNIPTVDQALAALAANPAEFRAFEKNRAIEAPGMSRRAAVEKALDALRARRSATASAGTATNLREEARLAAIELARAAAALRSRKSAPVATRPAARPAKPTIREQYNAITTPEGREKFRAANWSALLSSPK
jgi:hypothetical protein